MCCPLTAEFTVQNIKQESDTAMATSTLKGHASPTIPDDLVWYPFETMW
jgi:hypothetical protein